MKIGILTYYGVHNHGAVMQANALKQVLAEMGHEVSFLSFDRDYRYISSQQRNKYQISLKSIPFYVKYMCQRGLPNILYNVKKRGTLDRFRAECMGNLVPYSEFHGDAVIIGSDEVFSLEIGFNSMLFGLSLPVEKRLSYAASFGPTTLEDIERKEMTDAIAVGLKGLSSLGVRDRNSQDLVQSITGKNATLVCDPVILYGYKKEMSGDIACGKYAVVYAYDSRMNDMQEVEQIKAFAKSMGLKLVSVGFYHPWCDRNVNVSPYELLKWIKGAEVLITDTFHGTVFSIICNTPMVVKLRNNSNKLHFLLEEYGIEDRITEDFSNLKELAAQPLDFEKINKILEAKRTASKAFLCEALGERT